MEGRGEPSPFCPVNSCMRVRVKYETLFSPLLQHLSSSANRSEEGQCAHVLELFASAMKAAAIKHCSME